MPGPLIRKPQPVDIPSLASKLPRPLQKPAAILGSLAMDLTGGNDPADVSQMGPAAPLVSMYRNPAVRKMFTDEALEEAKQLYPEHVWPKIEELFGRYPRVAAHTKIEGVKNLRQERGAEGLTNWTEHQPNWQENTEGVRMPVQLDEDTVGQAATPDLLMHELTHVAQSLGNPAGTPQAYAMAMKGLREHPQIVQNSTTPERIAQSAYLNNPFEKSARISALRAGREIPTAPRPVVRGLQDFISTDPGNKYLQDAMDIMMRRR